MAFPVPDAATKEYVDTYVAELFHRVVYSTAFEEEIVEVELTRQWNFCPSVGTWFLPCSLKAGPCKQVASHRSDLQEEDKAEEGETFAHIAAELSLRQAAFDFFWQQQDEAEAEEKFAHIAAELSQRQAAFDFFWQQQDEAEAEEKFAHIAAELSLRQAAFDFFWQQQDEEEQSSKFAYMEAELMIRQVAWDLFWQQREEEEQEEERREMSGYLEAELSLRQAAFDAFWEEREEPAKTTCIKTADADAACSFIMVGSPAKSLRRLAKEATFKMGVDESWSSKLALYLKLPSEPAVSQDSQKSARSMTRSSSTSAMAMDLGIKEEPKASSRLSKSSMGCRSSSVSALGPLRTSEFGRKADTRRQQAAKPGSSALGWTVPGLDMRSHFAAGARQQGF